MRTALYVRVSAERQQAGTIEQQVALLRTKGAVKEQVDRKEAGLVAWADA